jgi:benzylsuccinate CoA-transferase BbsF subunit
VAGLDFRARTGQGQLIEVSQFESAVSILGSGLLDYELNQHVRTRSGNRHPAWAPHGVYPCLGIDR